jgi:uncharacterized membrane protein YedE/YeeE
MNAVSDSLHAMGVEQYLLAFLFLASYSLALSEFSGTRGRACAALFALTAGVAFAALTDPWFHGVMVIAFALVGMGVFAGISWALWTFLDRPARAAVAAAVQQPEVIEEPAATERRPTPLPTRSAPLPGT